MAVWKIETRKKNSPSLSSIIYVAQVTEFWTAVVGG